MQRGSRAGSFSIISRAVPQHKGKLESGAPIKKPATPSEDEARAFGIYRVQGDGVSS